MSPAEEFSKGNKATEAAFEAGQAHRLNEILDILEEELDKVLFFPMNANGIQLSINKIHENFDERVL